ncbi:hypothetical protein DPMN_058875 [Dreissena polymorpha]|uniref:Uncharacterized protein n=1 Tax=Dreissena polymorpha TaxID=45954 RepID=A0A9D4C2J6_DREPO|nr:hypothetical protein DPMN_058875 [Dreissena polymorpha]
MVQDFGWQSLQHRRYLARLSMLFRIHHHLIEVSRAAEAPTFRQMNQGLTPLQSGLGCIHHLQGLLLLTHHWR